MKEKAILQKAFTLLELLIVIAIIGILASMVMVGFRGSTDKAKLANAKRFSQGVRSSLGAYTVGAWSLENLDGNIARDESGFNSNCSVVGSGLSVAQGAIGNGVNFTGSGYLNCANPTNLQVAGSMTLAFWAKPSNVASPSRQNPVCKAYWAEFCLTMEPSGSLSYYHGNGSGYMGASAGGMFVNNQWVFVVIARDNPARLVKIYKNGALVSTTAWSSIHDPVASASSFLISAGYVSYFRGVIDDVRIYKEPFTLSQVQELYLAGLKDHQNELAVY